MTRDQALDFLRRHQPMPSDRELSPEVIDSYDQARKYFQENPDNEAVPLFLNSFGEGSGFGVYQLVEDVLTRLPKEAVIPHLVNTLASEHRGVRYWSSQIAGRFPDSKLVPHLKRLLQEPDFDQRYAAITALEQVGDDEALGALRSALESETDEELRDLILEILAERSPQ